VSASGPLVMRDKYVPCALLDARKENLGARGQ
jgi:hypothetical protein